MLLDDDGSQPVSDKKKEIQKANHSSSGFFMLGHINGGDAGRICIQICFFLSSVHASFPYASIPSGPSGQTESAEETVW